MNDILDGLIVLLFVAALIMLIAYFSRRRRQNKHLDYHEYSKRFKRLK